MKDQARVTRTPTLPRFAAQEAAKGLRYPYTLKLNRLDAVLHYRTRQRSDLDYGEALLRRRLFAWLVAHGQRVGASELNEYDPNGCADNDEFLRVMDATEQYEADMSVALCSCWDDVIGDVTLCGPILDFRYAWVAPAHARGDLFPRAAHALIDRFRCRYSILVIKAFPLEYQAQEPEAAARTSRALESRQRAMARYYERIFCVRPFPELHGSEGWLFRLRGVQI